MTKIFLTSDPYPLTGAQPEKFIIVLDGAAKVESTPEKIPDGRLRLRYDISSLGTGLHTAVVFAQGGEFTSAPSVISFSLGIDAPTGLVVEADGDE